MRADRWWSGAMALRPAQTSLYRWCRADISDALAWDPVLLLPPEPESKEVGLLHPTPQLGVEADRDAEFESAAWARDCCWRSACSAWRFNAVSELVKLGSSEHIDNFSYCIGQTCSGQRVHPDYQGIANVRL